MNIDYSIFRFPMCVIYEYPEDFPKDYVVRIFDINTPTIYYMIKKTLQDCRKEICRAGFNVRVNRSNVDDPEIVETWI